MTIVQFYTAVVIAVLYLFGKHSRWRQIAKIAAVAFVILYVLGFVIGTRRHDGFKQCVNAPNISVKEFRACQQRWLPPPAVPFDPDAPYQSVDPAPKSHVDPEWEEFKNLVIGLLLLFGEYIVLPFGLLIWACWHLGSLFNGLSDIHASNVARHLERPKDFKDGVEKTSKDILAECEAHHQEQRRLWTVEDVRLRRELAVDKRNDSPRPTNVGLCPEFEEIQDHINHDYNPNAPWRSVTRDEKAGVPRTKNSLGYDNSKDKYFEQEVARMGWNARPLTAHEEYGIISDFEK